MTDWSAAHQEVLARFTAGWKAPSPHVWDDMLAEDVELVQPMVRSGRGRELWWQEAARILTLMPDLHGDVLGWSGIGDSLYIEIRFSGTLGGAPLSWRAVDQIRISSDGLVTRRESFFDPSPLVTAVLTRPRAWLAWWRSGIAPLSSRRRLFRR